MAPLQTSSDLLWMTLLLAAVLLGFGVFVARRGSGVRRRGDTPHCRKCDYIVAGLETATCPECGADLKAAGAIVHGERQVRSGRVGLGVFVALIGLFVGVAALTPRVRRIDWYQYKPTRWVTADLKSRDAAVSNRAWRELMRRYDAKGLSAGQKGSILDVLIDALERDQLRVGSEPLKYLLTRAQGKEMSPGQRERFFAEMLKRLAPDTSQRVALARDAIERLIADGLLTDEQHARLTEAALAEQARGQSSSVAAQWLLNYLGERELAGKLSPQQREQFYNNAHNVYDMVVRKRVILGDLAPYRYSMGGRGPETPYAGKNPIWWTRTKVDRVMLDGKTVQEGGGSSAGSGFSRGTSGSWVPVKAPGKHRIEVALTMEVHYGPSMDDTAPDGLRWKKQVTLGQDFEVLAQAPPGFIRWIDDRSRADVIKKSITPRRLNRAYRNGEGLNVQFEISKVPENVGFEVFGVVGGKEHRLGTLTARAGTEIGSHLGASTFPPTPDGKVDLILRTDEKAVRQTIDMYEAWRGELVYKDVPVTQGRQ